MKLDSLSKTVRFTSLIRPMIYFLLFSLVYGAGYLWSTYWQFSSALVLFIQCMWLALYGLGLYFVCTMVWGRKRGTLRLFKSGSVFLICLAIALFAGYPLWFLSRSSLVLLRLLATFLGLVLLLFAMPSLIVCFRAFYEDVRTAGAIWRFILAAWQKHFWQLLNLWLVWFLIMVLWDTMLAGPLFMMSGFDPAAAFTSLIFLKEPGIYSEMVLLLQTGMDGAWELGMLSLIGSLIALFVDCNLISRTGELAAKAQNEEN